ncbi:RrF2 family transcriptional regulator [Psychroflexus halocasei]|uniref:Rrf2 family protein n=1 Tax=Psychroflexus halocasei TaxID=908615 RepID=A0A1H3ZQ64_9FLAO|nr:Rrf2 family transcriptional regulator [Psychroflexus halocasei]SEA25501.1 Rrf2 family protein [Psychroflexus halocasei]
MFSKACEYGIKAAVFITQQSIVNKRVSLGDISDNIDSPKAFTAKVLQILTRENIIQSLRGAHGGFYISETKYNNVKLKDIVYAIDGDKIYNGCALGFKKCNKNRPCPMHYQFKSIRDDLKSVLSTTSLHDLATDVEVGISYLKL